MSDLDARMLSAHQSGDHRALIPLYQEAANRSADRQAASFYLTHAYVFALEAGDPRAPHLHAQLKAWGSEA